MPLLLLLFLVPEREICYAQDMPYVVIDKDVWLLREDGEKLFLLPETYYAPLVGIDETYYEVTFNGVAGKIPKSSVSVTGYHQEATGTTQTLHISEKYSSFTALRIRTAPGGPMEEDAPAVPVGEPFTFLGDYPSADGEWYYVCYGDKYGYVSAEFCDKKIEVQPFVPEEKPSDDVPVEEVKEEKKEDDLLKILVIAGVAVTIVILLFVLLLPRKGKKTRYYYES